MCRSPYHLRVHCYLIILWSFCFLNIQYYIYLKQNTDDSGVTKSQLYTDVVWLVSVLGYYCHVSAAIPSSLLHVSAVAINLFGKFQTKPFILSVVINYSHSVVYVYKIFCTSSLILERSLVYSSRVHYLTKELNSWHPGKSNVILLSG